MVSSERPELLECLLLTALGLLAEHGNFILSQPDSRERYIADILLELHICNRKIHRYEYLK